MAKLGASHDSPAAAGLDYKRDFVVQVRSAGFSLFVGRRDVSVRVETA
jgi:hypothetical protein